MKEVKIAENMLALARKRGGKKGGNKRSAMLRMVMPFLSRDDGETLADAIDQRDTVKFNHAWSTIRKKIEVKLAKTRHAAHASASEEDLVDRMESELVDFVKSQ